MVQVVELAKAGGAIDHITSTGHTALTLAAASGAHALDHTGKDVMAVQLLLDRKHHRPKVDRGDGGSLVVVSAARSDGGCSDTAVPVSAQGCPDRTHGSDHCRLQRPQRRDRVLGSAWG